VTTIERASRGHLGLQVERLVSALEATAEIDRRIGRTDDDAPLIGIVGDRGSGKTTLLKHLCEVIAERGEFIVLPIVRPEMLATSESLLVTMLSSITTLPETQSEIFDQGTDMSQLGALGQRALRSAILATTGSLRELYGVSGSLGQFASDSAAVLGRAASVVEDLRTYVDHVLSATGRRGILVPIDDIDLAPGRLSKILVDVRAISECRGVHPVTCLSWDDLRANLRAETAGLFPTLGQLGLERLVEQQVMKTLRPDRVFEPLQLPRNEKFGFTPNGSDESLGSLFSSTFSLADGDLAGSMHRWAKNLSTELKGSELSLAWLPETYRGLEHLYFELAGLREALRDDKEGLEIAHHVRALVATLNREVPGRAVQIDFHSVAADGDRPQISATAEWPNYRLGVSSSTRWKRVFHNSGTRIALREVNRVVCSVRISDPDAKEQSEDRRKVSAREVSSVLLTQSILATEMFASPRPVGPLAISQSDCGFLQSVLVIGLPTDDQVLLLPPSTGIVHVERWMKAWNWMVRKSANQSKSKAPIEVALAQLCRAVSRIWWDGATPETVDASTDLVGSIEEVAALYVRLARVTSPDVDWEVSAAKAYCEWFEEMLPKSFHEALLSQPDLTASLQIWQAAVATNPTGDGATIRLRSRFEAKLDPLSGTAKAYAREKIYLFGYRALVRNLSGDLSLALSEYEKEYLERSGKGSKGRDAVDASVVLSESSGRYRFASRKTAEGRAQAADIIRLLDQLRQV